MCPLSSLDKLPYRTLQWLVAVFVFLHNLEEALTIPAYAPVVRRRLAAFLPATLLGASEMGSWIYIALVVVTLVPAIIVFVATRKPASRLAARAVVFVQIIFLLNVFVPHIPAAFLLGGYAPGVATAVGINLPYSLYFLRRSAKEGVIRRGAVFMDLIWAVLGPALAFVLLRLLLGSLL